MSAPKAASTVINAATAATQAAAQSMRISPFWVREMPTRQIAHVLLQQERNIMGHDTLFSEVEKSGLFRSRRHFKHCLRMLKDQKRARVICQGPERAGSAKRLFAVQLTRRGATIYHRYSKDEGKGGKQEKQEHDREKEGIAQALE